MRTPGAITQATDHQQQLDKQHDADQRADRQIVEEALAQLGEIDVEHHHHEQEQHGDGADIDDDQDHGEKLGAEQHEQPGRVDEARIRNSTECTGLCAAMTMTAEATQTPANR